MLSIEELVALAVQRGASDLHLVCGLPPKGRIDGQLENLLDDVLDDATCNKIAKELALDDYEKIEKIGELDLSRTLHGERVRINLFRQQGHISGALRILSSRIPKLSDLALPPIVQEFPSYKKGIILVTGETGSGKSTTLAAILDQINHTKAVHIITLEDPIEYIYTPDKAMINQREVGADTQSYTDGLRAVLREDPDIILIGEMRDMASIETAMTAAETGHLVFATLHTNSAPDSIDRIVGTFPAERQPQVRIQLAATLQAILSQQLLVRKGGKGRVVACECMINTFATANLIREGKTPQIHSAMLSATDKGAVTMDNCLIRMVKDGAIDRKTAQEAASDKEYLNKKLMF